MITKRFYLPKYNILQLKNVERPHQRNVTIVFNTPETNLSIQNITHQTNPIDSTINLFYRDNSGRPKPLLVLSHLSTIINNLILNRPTTLYY